MVFLWLSIELMPFIFHPSASNGSTAQSGRLLSHRSQQLLELVLARDEVSKIIRGGFPKIGGSLFIYFLSIYLYIYISHYKPPYIISQQDHNLGSL